jgi:serine/threonine protein phosphatase PrpC
LARFGQRAGIWIAIIPPYALFRSRLSLDMAEPVANWKNFVEYASLSDVGLRRSNNQDSLAIAMAGDESHWLVRGHLFMVADGMGAHAAGELASKMACNSVPHTYHKLVDRPAPEALRQAIIETNAQIHDRGQASADFNGMGTTASVLVLLPQGAIVGHIGDSRAYRLRGTTLHQLTFDHSLVWEMKAAGQFGPGETPAFVPKNIITRSLGPHAQAQVDLEGPFPLDVGDTFLLCSDGLSGQVTDQEIGLVMGALTPKEAVRALIDLANLRGGPDNITVVIARVIGRVQAQSVDNVPDLSFSVARGERPTVSLAVWVSIGVSLLLAAGLGFAGYTIPAFACVVAALLGVVVAVLQRTGSMETERVPVSSGALGRGPHVAFNCTPTAEQISGIAEVVQKLRDAGVSEGWQVNWAEFDAYNARATAAINSQNFAQAVREYCLAISFMVAEVRRQRGKKGRDSTVLE